MKKETASDKLSKLLGIAPEVVEKVKEKKAKVEAKRNGKVIGITEDHIQDFRAAQGLIYFLQAPELFKPKVCKNPNCKLPFIVSRIDVAYCSYTCIHQSLYDLGIDWKQGAPMEEIIENLVVGNGRKPGIYEGNEPIWILGVENLERCLTMLHKIVSSSDSIPLLPAFPNKAESPKRAPSTK